MSKKWQQNCKNERKGKDLFNIQKKVGQGEETEYSQNFELVTGLKKTKNKNK